MPDQMILRDRTAVITGAASGIGRAIAVSLAERGCHLALSDVDEAGLAETARLVARPSVLVSRHRLDVSDRDAIVAFPERVLAEHPRIDLLVNNAGVALGGTFEQVTEADFDWLFSINFHGVVRMTPSTDPSSSAMTHAASAVASVQPRPTSSEWKYVPCPSGDSSQ